MASSMAARTAGCTPCSSLHPRAPSSPTGRTASSCASLTLATSLSSPRTWGQASPGNTRTDLRLASGAAHISAVSTTAAALCGARARHSGAAPSTSGLCKAPHHHLWQSSLMDYQGMTYIHSPSLRTVHRMLVNRATGSPAPHVIIIIFFFPFWRQGVTLQFRLPLTSLCSPGCSQLCNNSTTFFLFTFCF